MTIDREAVNARVAQAQPRRQGGVAGLLGGIHRSAELKGWLKPASIALRARRCPGAGRRPVDR
ncbi:hypothetical protein ACU686_17920 [Yinghuangia aomiensis]